MIESIKLSFKLKVNIKNNMRFSIKKIANSVTNMNFIKKAVLSFLIRFTEVNLVLKNDSTAVKANISIDITTLNWVTITQKFIKKLLFKIASCYTKKNTATNAASNGNKFM